MLSNNAFLLSIYVHIHDSLNPDNDSLCVNITALITFLIL